MNESDFDRLLVAAMNCKPGDIAIVTHSSCGNEGLIVQVIGPSLFGPGEQGPEWHIRSSRATPCTDHLGMLVMSADSEHPDAWLRPISGIPDEQTVERAEPVTA